MKRLRFRYKFLIPGAVAFFILLIASIYSFQSADERKRHFEEMSKEAMDIVEQTEQMQYKNGDLVRYLFLYVEQKDPRYMKSANEAYLKVFLHLKNLEASVSNPRDLEMLQDFEKTYLSIDALMKDITNAISSNNEVHARELFKQFLMAYSYNRAKIKDIKAIQSMFIQSKQDSFNAAYEWMNWTLIITAIIALLSMIGMIIYYEIIFIRPLHQVNRMISRMSKMDFTYEVPLVYQDELGDLNRALSSASYEIGRRMEIEKDLNRKLTEANDELQHFSTITSHDLKEPLRHVRINSELLQMDFGRQLPPQALEHLFEIMQGCDRMIAMVNGLQSLFNVGSGETKFEDVNLKDAVNGALANLTPTINEKKVEVIQAALPHVVGNLSLLTELFQNLIINAIKYNRANHPKIEIYVDATLGDSQFCTIAVRDNGIGIPQPFQEKIFRLYTRLHTTDNFPGSGIGLALCKKIVRHHGGAIWVTSTEGEGSTFFIRLPRFRDA